METFTEEDVVMSKKKKKNRTNPIAVAMMKRYSRTQVHKDRRMKRQDKNSWKKELE